MVSWWTVTPKRSHNQGYIFETHLCESNVKSLGVTEVPKRKNVKKDGREQREEQCLAIGTETHNWREKKEMVLRVR